MSPRALLPIPLLSLAYVLSRAATVARVRNFENLDADTADIPGVRLYLRGRRIHLTIDGQGPPLLMLHGFGSSGVAFRRLTPLLKEHLTLIAPDLPGWGYSERSPQQDHSHETNAALMLELLNRLGIDSAVVLGHSVGAAIALRMAQAAPNRIAGLILAGGPGSDPSLPPLLDPLLSLIVPAIVESRTGQQWLNRSALADGSHVDPQAIDAYLTEARVPGHVATLLSQLTRTRHGPQPELSSITAPVLVMTGDADRYFSVAAAKRVAEKLPDARFVAVANAGHLLLEERPDVVSAAVLAFVRSVAGPMGELLPAPDSDHQPSGAFR